MDIYELYKVEKAKRESLQHELAALKVQMGRVLRALDMDDAP